MLCGKVADLLLCRGSIPVLTMLWWIYVFIVALPFVVLKNNSLGEGLQKRPPAFVAAKITLGFLCAIVLQLCL